MHTLEIRFPTKFVCSVELDFEMLAFNCSINSPSCLLVLLMTLKKNAFFARTVCARKLQQKGAIHLKHVQTETVFTGQMQSHTEIF